MRFSIGNDHDAESCRLPLVRRHQRRRPVPDAGGLRHERRAAHGAHEHADHCTRSTGGSPAAARGGIPAGYRVDEYYWLRDDTRADPEVIAYLEAENAYKKAMTAHLQPLEDRIYEEIVGRIKQDDTSVLPAPRFLLLPPLRDRPGISGLPAAPAVRKRRSR